MQTVLLRIGLFTLVRVLSVVVSKPCGSSSDCDTCGICVDKNSSETHCYYPYPETEVENNNCYFKHDMCQGYICKNDGNCIIEFGFSGPACFCNNKKLHMGQRCDIKWDEYDYDDWVTGFAVLFDQFREKSKTLQLYSLDVFVILYSSAKNLQFYLETSEGFVIRFNSYIRCNNFQNKRIHPYYPLCQPCWTKLPPCIIFYQTKVQFPYKLSPGPGMITRSGSVIGYIANITLVAKTLNSGKYQVISKNIHPIMVNYEDLQPDERQNMPSIVLQNCGKDLQYRIFYHKRMTISLNAKINIKYTSSKLVQSIWTIWEVEKLRTEYNTPNLIEIDSGYSWTLKPFTLETRIYRIQLKLNVIFGQKSVSNYGECFIEVIKSTVVAIIRGGWLKTVNNKYQITISGDKSYNPDRRMSNPNLKFFWSCSPQCTRFFQKDSVNKKQLTIPKGMMNYNQTYNFTLRVSAYGLEDGWATQMVYVSDGDEMSIYCLMNCLKETEPSDPLLLQVKLPGNEQLQHTFVWSITRANGAIVDSMNASCQNHTFPPYLLCVEPNTLSYGETYYLQANQVGSLAMATWKVKIGRIPNFSCFITPTKGEQLITLFKITCSNPGGHFSWVYEFFDKYDSDLSAELSGRMIGINNLGVLQDFKMFRGTIVVHLFDINGAESQWKQKIELTPYNATSEDVDGLFAEIEYKIEINKMELALKKASLVSELINLEVDKHYFAEKMVHLICKIPYISQPIMKLALMTVKNFITSLTKQGDFKIDSSMLRSLTQVIQTLTHLMDYAMGLSDTAMPSITTGMLNKMATAFVETIEVLLANRNESFFNTSLIHLGATEYEDALLASIQIERSFNKIGRALSFRQGTGYIKTSVVSSTNHSFITTQADYLKLVYKQINKDRHCSLKFSEDLIQELSSIEELTVQLTTLSYNPFWTGRRDISTSLLKLDLYDKDSVDLNMTRVSYIKNEIDLTLEVLHSKVDSAILKLTQLDPKSNRVEDIDKQLTVLRFDLVGHSKLFLSFSFENESDEIRLYVSERIRPDYELVNSSETLISPGYASYEKSAGFGISDRFVYIGLLPGPNVPVNGTVSVTVHFHYLLCLTWLRHRWVSKYCRVRSNTNSSNIRCSCTHLSFFGAVFAVPPNEIDPFNDIAIFLTLKDNWFVVIFMACLLAMFSLLGLWAKSNDARDKIHRTVLILEDNFPEDNNCYLLAVFTGFRLNAGTNANVGVKISGSESSSHSHVLKSSLRKVLRRKSEDWFMIRTPLPLGVVRQIHVWHDNTGVSPDWYCNKMVVYDLQTSKVYTFYVDQWLASESGEFCEAVLAPATSEEMCDVKRIILDNITFGFRDSDKSGSILARHPRSRIDRLDRVVILTCFIVLACFVSMAFYEVLNDDGDEGVDTFGFTFDSVDVLISFQTFVLSSVLLLIITITFEQAFKPEFEARGGYSTGFAYTRSPRRRSLKKSQTTVPILSKSVDEKSLYLRLVRKIGRTFHPLPFSPIVLSKSSAQVKTNRILYYAAWLMSILLTICCVFFIILYGLKLGQGESKTWLASIALVLVQEFLIASPLKTVLIGVILATVFERFVQIANYRILVKDFHREAQEKDESYSMDLINKRSQKMYKPIRGKRCDVLRRKQSEKKILLNLLDLFVVIAYIVIICLVTTNYSIQVQSNANFHVSQMVHLKHKSNQINFTDVYNRTLFYDFVDSTFVTALYSLKWYNFKTLNSLELKVQQRSRWWAMNEIMKLVGPPLWRQLRVDPKKKCPSLNQITENSSVGCIPNWGPGVEDREDYSYGWKAPTAFEAVDKETSAWKYVSPSQSNRLSRQGESWTTYHGGGYKVVLSLEKFETQRKIQTLRESKWIDEFTRVVFLDFTLFNVNENMFTEVALIAEHLPIGLYVTRSMINSVQLDMAHSVWKSGFILFILIIFFHVVKTLRLMNRKGFIKYFSEFENIYQLIVTGLGVISIIFFFVHLKVSLDYTELFQRIGLDVFFEFDKIVHFSILSANTLTILFCCLTFRLFSLWPFGGRSLNIYRTLFISGKSITRFLVLFFVYISVFCRLLSYLLNYMLSISAFYWQWSKSVHKCSSISDFIILFLLSFSVKLCLVYILMIFRFHYKLEKGKIVKRSDFVVLYKWLTRHR